MPWRSCSAGSAVCHSFGFGACRYVDEPIIAEIASRYYSHLCTTCGRWVQPLWLPCRDTPVVIIVRPTGLLRPLPAHSRIARHPRRGCLSSCYRIVRYLAGCIGIPIRLAWRVGRIASDDDDAAEGPMMVSCSVFQMPCAIRHPLRARRYAVPKGGPCVHEERWRLSDTESAHSCAELRYNATGRHRVFANRMH